LESRARQGEIILLYEDGNHPLALCPPQARVAAPCATLSPVDTPAEPESDQPRGGIQTPSLGPVSLLEPGLQGGAAQRHWRGPVWDLQSVL
jgi:hypothetical protein